MSRSVKRPYDSSRRQEQAGETRRTILRAAHDLFVEHGYGRTTIAGIARAAGVSPETIYATYRNKATLLHQVWDVTIGGDDEQVVFHERPEIRALRAEPDLGTRLMMNATFFTGVARRMTPFLLALQGAAASEPAAAEMLAEVGRQRLAGMSVMAADAAKTGQLAVSEQACRDLMWSTTDGMLWHRLVQQRGWSDEQYAQLIGRMWVAALVKPKRPARSRPAREKP